MYQELIAQSRKSGGPELEQRFREAQRNWVNQRDVEFRQPFAQMTHGILPAESLELLHPSLVSPGLLVLVNDDAPTRVVMCAGAGHFACASVTLTQGRYVGGGNDAGDRVVANWEAIADRTADLVPAYGFTQAEREVASAKVNR